MITQKEHEYLEKKYGKLIQKISNYIHGDLARDTDDYIQDMWILLCKEIPKYLEKTGLTLEEFCTTYNNYVKQWLWTYKNNTGAKISAKRDLLSAPIRLGESSELHNSKEEDISFELQDQNAPYLPLMMAELQEDNTTVDSVVLSSITFGEDTVKENGTFNRVKISEQTGLPPSVVKHSIDRIYKEYIHALNH